MLHFLCFCLQGCMQIWKNIDFSVLSSFFCSFSAYSKKRIVLHKNFNIFLSCLLEWILFHSQEVVLRKTKKTLRLRQRRRRWWETAFRKVWGNLIFSAKIWWEASDRLECRNEKKSNSCFKQLAAAVPQRRDTSHQLEVVGWNEWKRFHTSLN